MDNFNLKKYLAENKLLKEIKVNDPSEFRKHGPMIDSGGTPLPLGNKPLATFLEFFLSGMDEGEIDEVADRRVITQFYDEGSEQVKAFDYVYNSLKNNKLTKFTTDDGEWIYYYQLSIYDENNPSIQIISNVEEK